MARLPRIDKEDALYHVTSRGNARQRVFHADADRGRFLAALADNVATHGVLLRAYVLMNNHFHCCARIRGAVTDVELVRSELEARRVGRITEQDIALVRRRVSLAEIERLVEERCGLPRGSLRSDGRPAPDAKAVAAELAAPLERRAAARHRPMVRRREFVGRGEAAGAASRREIAVASFAERGGG